MKFYPCLCSFLIALSKLSGNEFIYGQGSVEVSSQVNEYQKIAAKKPIQGTVFITHDQKDKVDESSFRLGKDPIKATWLRTTQMSLSSPLVVSIYSFEVKGLPLGTHTLPQISVTVGGKVNYAPSMVIQVGD